MCHGIGYVFVSVLNDYCRAFIRFVYDYVWILDKFFES